MLLTPHTGHHTCKVQSKHLQMTPSNTNHTGGKEDHMTSLRLNTTPVSSELWVPSNGQPLVKLLMVCYLGMIHTPVQFVHHTISHSCVSGSSHCMSGSLTISHHSSVVWHFTFFYLCKQLQAEKSGKATSKKSLAPKFKKCPSSHGWKSEKKRKNQ